MGACASNPAPEGSAKAGASAASASAPMANVLSVGKPSQCDPTGTGMIVNDILTPWRFRDTDPFILLHEFGPTTASTDRIPIGMHPHRGFNEVPYLKQGHWIGTDAWKPDGDASNPMVSGSLQWGFIGSGIEHGAKFDRKYRGPMHGFQLWVNLPCKEKLDPPCFQDCDPESLPTVSPSDGVQVKILVGELAGTASPVDTGSLQVQYFDVMMRPGTEASHDVPEGHTAVFLYMYAGSGQVCGRFVKRGAIVRLDTRPGPIVLSAHEEPWGALLLAGVPLQEKIVQHGPFVMTSRQQIQQAFSDYQSGNFLNESCKYIRHTAHGPKETVLKRA